MVGLNLLDPLVSFSWGITLLDERPHSSNEFYVITAIEVEFLLPDLLLSWLTVASDPPAV